MCIRDRFCNGVYTFYKGYSPRCTRHGHSGNIDVVTAIKWSCNVFFYDVGRRLTSDVYDAYAYKLGLGQRTGVEAVSYTHLDVYKRQAGGSALPPASRATTWCSTSC